MSPSSIRIIIESDLGRLKSRLKPMRGLRQLHSAQVISAGHAFVQNLRRDHYELSVDVNPHHRLPASLHRARLLDLNSAALASTLAFLLLMQQTSKTCAGHNSVLR
jgi:hypothetical protein